MLMFFNEEHDIYNIYYNKQLDFGAYFHTDLHAVVMGKSLRVDFKIVPKPYGWQK